MQLVQDGQEGIWWWPGTLRNLVIIWIGSEGPRYTLIVFDTEEHPEFSDRAPRPSDNFKNQP